MSHPPRRHRLRLASALLVLVLGAGGCTTIASLNSSARPVDTYALNPVPAQPGAGGGRRLIYVAEPVAAGAFAGDRIVMKPSPIEVTLLGDGRWVQPAPALLRTLLARSLANTGRYALVSTSTVGPLPDFTLTADIDSFQAELLPSGGAPARVVVAMTLTVLRDVDGRLVSSHRFSRSTEAAGTDARSIVLAFDAATGALLRDAVSWATAVMTGSPRT
jgi:cholesterol transport system auxiliary component